MHGRHRRRTVAGVSGLSDPLTGTVFPAAAGGSWFEVGDPAASEAVEGRLRVRGVVPGERVTVVPDADDPPWARVVAVHDISPERRGPPCELAGDCGGCHWLHIDEPAQRRLKVAQALDALQRAGVPAGSVPEIEVLPSPLALAYRHRARFQIAPHPAGGPSHVGFHRPGSREVLDVPRCPLLAPPLARAFAAFRSALEGAGTPDDLTGIELTAPLGTAGALASINPRDRAPTGWPAWGSRLLEAASGLLAAVAVQPGRHAPRPHQLGEAPLLGHTPAGRPLAACPGSFVQSNLAAADRLLDAVLERAAPRPGQRVLELFSGGGTLGWCLAAAGAHVTAVELGAEALRAASVLPTPPDGRLEQRAGDAARALEQAAAGRADVVVANPPRSGLGHARRALIEAAPPRVVLACCSHAGFAADAAALWEGGYRLVRPALVDMFPQTRHPELVAAFERA
jgi:23S rRNA (uracil1939-C5)-methyltransferase